MTRLRYKKNNDYLVSELILIGEKFGYVVLNPKTLEYSIQGENNKSIFKGSANNMAQLKKNAKAALKVLGTVFQDEIRNRGTTEKMDLDKL